MNVKKLIILCTAIILIIFSNLYSKTKGLVDPYSLDYISEHMSVDSDDDLNIEIAKIIFLPFLIFYFTIIFDNSNRGGGYNKNNPNW